MVVVDRDGISRVDTDRTVDRDFSTRPEIAVGARREHRRGNPIVGHARNRPALCRRAGRVREDVVHGAVRVTLDTSDVNARIHRFWLGLAAIAAWSSASSRSSGGGWPAPSPDRFDDSAATPSRFAGGDLTVEP